VGPGTPCHDVAFLAGSLPDAALRGRGCRAVHPEGDPSCPATPPNLVFAFSSSSSSLPPPLASFPAPLLHVPFPQIDVAGLAPSDLATLLRGLARTAAILGRTPVWPEAPCSAAAWALPDEAEEEEAEEAARAAAADALAGLHGQAPPAAGGVGPGRAQHHSQQRQRRQRLILGHSADNSSADAPTGGRWRHQPDSHQRHQHPQPSRGRLQAPLRLHPDALPYGPEPRCAWWRYIQGGCLDGGRGMLPWEFQRWKARAAAAGAAAGGAATALEPAEGVNVLRVRGRGAAAAGEPGGTAGGADRRSGVGGGGHGHRQHRRRQQRSAGASQVDEPLAEQPEPQRRRRQQRRELLVHNASAGANASASSLLPPLPDVDAGAGADGSLEFAVVGARQLQRQAAADPGLSRQPVLYLESRLHVLLRDDWSASDQLGGGSDVGLEDDGASGGNSGGGGSGRGSNIQSSGAAAADARDPGPTSDSSGAAAAATPATAAAAVAAAAAAVQATGPGSGSGSGSGGGGGSDALANATGRLAGAVAAAAARAARGLGLRRGGPLLPPPFEDGPAGASAPGGGRRLLKEPSGREQVQQREGRAQAAPGGPKNSTGPGAPPRPRPQPPGLGHSEWQRRQRRGPAARAADRTQRGDAAPVPAAAAAAAPRGWGPVGPPLLRFRRHPPRVLLLGEARLPPLGPAVEAYLDMEAACPALHPPAPARSHGDGGDAGEAAPKVAIGSIFDEGGRVAEALRRHRRRRRRRGGGAGPLLPGAAGAAAPALGVARPQGPQW
jgi:hypothetical protein